jgi:phage baseplate assembly protein V
MNGFDQLSNAMRAQAGLAQNELSMPRWGVISSYDPDAPAVKVMIQPEGVESVWMALGALGVGNGFGVAIGPGIGDMVLVMFPEGDFNSGVIIGRFFSTSNQAISVPSGEIWAMHTSGSFVKLVSSGDVEVSAAGNIVVTAGGDVDVTAGGNLNAAATGSISMTAPTITLNGSIALNGPISQTNTSGGSTRATLIGPLSVTNDVTAAGKSVSTHTHHENGAGNNTDQPN